MNVRPTPSAYLWQFGDTVFDEQAMTLRVNGADVELARKPLELLSMLLNHAGEVVTKGEILDALWPDRDISEASLTNCVARLRAALSDENHTIVRTAHGFGYRFDASVSVREADPRTILLPPKVDLSAGDPVPDRPGWRLVCKLGAGGFGDAWLGEAKGGAEQRVFKFASHDTGLIALRREVALGRLLYEGLGPRDDINRVLDWNFTDAPYFIELAYWPEGNLVEWSARQGGLTAIDITTRLDLVAQIADALAAAHSMGVLHKDLKPTNILVRSSKEKRAAIVLTDFGSGRALDLSRFAAFSITGFDAPTGPETTSGTAMYRAPELLAGGAPTVQADLYALGVLLFQMVTGDFRRSLAPGWEHLVDDEILREDIAAAAAGDPTRRISDAAELPRRLRDLDRRRAEAARDAAAQKEYARTRQALERSRARRIPILALIVVLFAGLATSTFLYLRAQRIAAQERAVTSFLTDDLLSSANPMVAGNPDIKVKDVLKTASTNLDRRFPNGGLDRAAIEAALGQVYSGLADPKHAEVLLNAALDRRRAELGNGAPETQAIRVALADLYERNIDNKNLGRVGRDILAAGTRDAPTSLHARYALLVAGCDTETGTICIRNLRAMLTDTRNALGLRDPLTLRIQSNLAYHLSNNEGIDEALSLARQAIALSAQLYGKDHPLVQERRFHLAEILNQAGKQAEAIEILEDVRRVLLKISGHETELTIRATNQLGFAYLNAKRYDEALRCFQTALDYNLKTRGENFEGTYEAYNNIAGALSNMGHQKEAIIAAEKAWNLERRAAGADNPDTLWFENNLAMDYRKDGDLAKALQLWSDVVQRGRKVFTHGEWDLAQFLYRHGETEAMLGDGQAARRSLAESIRLFTLALGPRHPRTLAAEIALRSLSGADRH